MVGVVAAVLSSHVLGWESGIGFLFQIGRDNRQSPLLPKRRPLLQPVDLFGVNGAGLPALLHQPQALRQKGEQHEPGQYLWPTEAFVGEETSHWETASVLPWRVSVRETSTSERGTT